MTDFAKETNQETEVPREEKEETKESDGYEPSKRPNSDFLYELNLLVVLLSLFSLSSEDWDNCTEEDRKSREDDEAKASLSRVYSRKRDRDVQDVKLKPIARRIQRFQPMIKDSRHGRKM